MSKNLCGKTRDVSDPYEVWQSGDGEWTWNVLKKYQSPEKERENPYARWWCNVVTPICPDGELGDVYVRDIMRVARMIKGEPDLGKVMRDEADKKNLW